MTMWFAMGAAICLFVIIMSTWADRIMDESGLPALVDEEDEHTHCSCAGCRGQCFPVHGGTPNCDWCCGKACSGEN